MQSGLIYRQFADNPNMFIRDEAVDEYGNRINFMIISIGIDYGATERRNRVQSNRNNINV